VTRGGVAIQFGREGAGRFLPWLTALMVFLAALALASVMALDRSLARWNAGLAGTLTVELPAAQGASDNGLAAALAVLRRVPGVTRAEPLSRAEIAKLVEPYLGQALSPDDLALPQLIDVRLDPVRPASAAGLKALLAQAAPAARLDDHAFWLGDLRRFARSVELTAFLILALVAASAAWSVTFVTRAGLSMQRDVIELLHLMGAHDSYVARLFERAALRLSLIGGLGGFALAAAVLLALGKAAGAADLLGDGVALLPTLHLKGWDWAALAALPAAASAIAMTAARITVLASLRRIP
jgi:cell division transport system permease protein